MFISVLVCCKSSTCFTFFPVSKLSMSGTLPFLTSYRWYGGSPTPFFCLCFQRFPLSLPFFQRQVAKVKARSFITRFVVFLLQVVEQQYSPGLQKVRSLASTSKEKRKVSFVFALFSNCDATQVRPPLVPNIFSQLFTNGTKIFESVHVLSA